MSKRALADSHGAEHGGWEGAAKPMPDGAAFCWIVLTGGCRLPSVCRFIQGYRVIGNIASRNRDKRIVLIVTVATSMAIGGATLQKGFPLQKFAEVATLTSLNTPIAQISAAAQVMNQEKARPQIHPQIPEPEQPAPALSR